MAAADKLAGTCSVCLRAMQLHGDSPIRHGFKAVGVRHGQHGGHHTGPCMGTRFPHLGLSTEGTVWALDRERTFLQQTKDALVKLATNPDLTWYPTKYDVRGGRPDYSRPVVLKHGEEEPYGIGAPSYDRLHRAKKAMLESHERMAERAIAEYERVLASWSPEKYPVSGAPKKVETVHMATPLKNNRGETWTGILCRFTKQGYASDKIAKTDDPRKVTCKRCRTALGLPPL
jgi:hypothetical protein